ncbi:MAG: hypothetical protein AB1512_11505 [Thermodesulfobacteriota bacterium]
MEQVREARDRGPQEAWVEAGVVKGGEPAARAEADAVRAEEVAARGEVAASRQARAGIASVLSVGNGLPIDSDTLAMSSNVPSAEPP